MTGRCREASGSPGRPALTCQCRVLSMRDETIEKIVASSHTLQQIENIGTHNANQHLNPIDSS